MLRLIDAMPLEDEVKQNTKFVLIAQKVDTLPTHHDLEKQHLKQTIRFGMMVAAGVGVLATLMKVL